MRLYGQSLLYGQDFKQEGQLLCILQLWSQDRRSLVKHLLQRSAAMDHFVRISRARSWTDHACRSRWVVSHPHFCKWLSGIWLVNQMRTLLAGKCSYNAFVSRFAPIVVLGKRRKRQELDPQAIHHLNTQPLTNLDFLLRRDLSAPVRKNIRMQQLQGLCYGVVLVHRLHGGIHALKGPDQLYPLACRERQLSSLWLLGSTLCLTIVVDNHDEACSKIPGLLQVGDVPVVQRVEVAGGHNHTLRHPTPLQPENIIPPVAQSSSF
mmetsp:Transcript_71508/g.170796  ORF Transcript_71508/g.170796 Transcript_71508/m.170796 type:complete len:264 (+) Transcript_71508:944-1735(+)